jgi:hypothetical protein
LPPRWGWKARELRRAIALADAEIEAAVGQEVERGNLLCEQYRIVPGQHHHRRAETDAFGAAGKIAQEVERGRQLADTREVVLDHEHAVIAEFLGIEHIVDVLPVAEAVSNRACAGRLGPAEQSEFHGLAPVFARASYLVSGGRCIVRGCLNYCRRESWARPNTEREHPRQLYVDDAGLLRRARGCGRKRHRRVN